MSYFVDTHCHLNSEDYKEDLSLVVDRAVESGLRRMLVVGGDIPSSKEAVHLAEKYSAQGLFAAIGVHPHDASTISWGIPEELKSLACHPRVLAIGESGLDYFYDYSPRDIQQQVLLWHIQWAKEVDKPLILHVRDAFQDLFATLDRSGNSFFKGVIHCFSGNMEDGKRALDMGFYLSFAGPVTYKRNHILREVAASMPLDRLLCETDAPWLAPQHHRGKRNEPSFVTEVYDVVAEVRGISVEELKRVVWRNAYSLFQWEDQ